MAKKWRVTFTDLLGYQRPKQFDIEAADRDRAVFAATFMLTVLTSRVDEGELFNVNSWQSPATIPYAGLLTKEQRDDMDGSTALWDLQSVTEGEL